MTLSSQSIAIVVLLVFFVVFLSVSVPRISSVESVPQGTVLTLTGPTGQRVTIMVEIADDPKSRQIGLMFRTNLPAGSGMLFVFDREGPQSFWMKNTLIPLDILFFDQTGYFVSRKTMEPCEEVVCPTTHSGAPAQYALEVNRGEAKMAGVGEGWLLEMDN